MDVRSELLQDASAFSRYWEAIRQLRSRLGCLSDVMLSPTHFLATTDDQRRPCSVAVWRGEELVGLLYATQHYVKGIATGYAVGGDFSGRGLLVCASEDERQVLRESIKRLAAEGVHSMHLRLLPRDEKASDVFSPVIPAIKGLRMKILDAIIPGDLLRLQPNFEEFLSTLGKHTRRNIRACMRKTEQAGISFAGLLSREEYHRAVERLNAETDFPADPRRLVKDERLLELHDGERIGLRAADGTIIAVLCGFRRDGRFYLMTQLNDAHYERLSLSLVLRAYTAKYLIEGGVTSLHFLGGSSLSFGRYCEPEIYRSIFADRTMGLAPVFKKLMSLAVGLLERLGKPIPEPMAMLSGGNLDAQRLAYRTVLRPAAMLMRQRSLRLTEQDAKEAGESGLGTGAEPDAVQLPLLRESA